MHPGCFHRNATGGTDLDTDAHRHSGAHAFSDAHRDADCRRDACP